MLRKYCYDCRNEAEYWNYVTDDDVCFECMERKIEDNEWETTEDDYIYLKEMKGKKYE